LNSHNFECYPTQGWDILEICFYEHEDNLTIDA